MKRKDFVKFVQTGKSKGKSALITGKSVTDPTFARTGRQMIFQPLNIEYRMKYPEGVPLNKDNPLHFNEYDKLYPDQFKAMREAKEQVSTTKTKLNEIQKQSQQVSTTKTKLNEIQKQSQQQQQQQPTNPNN